MIGRTLALLLLASCTHPTRANPPAGLAASARSSASAPGNASSRPTPHARPSPPGSAEAAKPAPVQDRQTRLISRVMRRVSAARQLAATRTVPGVFLSRDALIARVKAHVDREVPKQAIVDEGLVLQLLGFIPTRFDYEAETYALLESQLAGFYEPADGTMYMASDLDDDNAQATLAHELVHALQDQHWDLGKRSGYTPGQGDRASAFSALAEGDATSAMADVLLSRARPGMTALDLPDELFAEQVIGSMSTGGVANVPHVMKTSLVAPYIDGTLFIHELRRKGGWAAVNRAWDDPPVTTEQILHVAKWEAHEPGLAVPEPPTRTLGPAWTVADSDTYGESGTRLAFEEWMGATSATTAAGGWGGDRGVLVRDGDVYAFAWRLRFDEAPTGHVDAYAARAWTALSPALEAKVGRPRLRDASPMLCIERGELGPLAVARRGRDLILVAGPASTGPRVWASAAHCDQAKAWIQEIAYSFRSAPSRADAGAKP